MAKRKRIILVVMYVLIAVSIVVQVYPFLLGRDTLPPVDGDLKVVRVNVPEKENAGYYFDRAALALEQSFQKNRKRLKQAGMEKDDAKTKGQLNELQALVDHDQWKPDQVAWFINENRIVSEDLERGLACRDFQVAEIKSFNDPLPQLGFLRNLGRYNSIQASYLFKMGKEKEALDETMNTIKLGHAIEGGGGTFLHFLIGRAVKELGLQRFRQLVQKTTLPAAALEPYIRELECYRMNLEGWRKVIQQEYRLECKMVDDLLAGKLSKENTDKKIPPSRLFLANHTKTLLAENLRIAIENGSKCYAARKPFIRFEVKNWFSKIQMCFTKNCVGKLLVGLLADSYERVIEGKCGENTSVSGTQLLLAIRLYKIKTGNLPASLGQLVPDYLNKVPVDDFDGLPMKYSAVKRVIYSVGSDLIDAGGIPDAKDRRKEICYRIEF